MGRDAITALFPGSFDPPTRGHLAILRQAAALFDEVLIGLAENPGKRSFLPVAARLELLESLVRSFDNVRVAAYRGLTARFARERGATVLVRGLRDARDLAYERELACGNEVLGHGLTTVFLLAPGVESAVSSRLVREIVHAAGPEAALPLLPGEIRETFLRLAAERGP